MTDDVIQATLVIWAARNLPARLDVAATAKLLGFPEHDIQILMAKGKLTPLGDPAPNAPKWFAAVQIIRLAADEDWLHKATREIAKYWRCKRERQQTSAPLPQSTRRRIVRNHVPMVSPDHRMAGDNGTRLGGELKADSQG